MENFWDSKFYVKESLVVLTGSFLRQLQIESVCKVGGDNIVVDFSFRISQLLLIVKLAERYPDAAYLGFVANLKWKIKNAK